MCRELDFVFQPWWFRKLWLPTRVVVSPVSATPFETLPAVCLRCAEQGAGLILAPAAAVSPEGEAAHAAAPNLFGGRSLRLWRRVTDAVHSTAGRVAATLAHAPLSPTLLSRAQMADIRTAYARAAGAACAVGFDAVQLEAVPGSLPAAFLDADLNRRRDEYGAERSRFVLELLHAVRRAVGRRVAMILSFRPETVVDTLSELDVLTRRFAAAGADLFRVRSADAVSPLIENCSLSPSGWVRYLSGCPVIASGGVGNASRLLSCAQQMRRGEIDLAEWAADGKA